MAEKIIWSGKSSQMTNFWIFCTSILFEIIIITGYFVIKDFIKIQFLPYIILALFIFPLIISAWKWLEVFFRRYTITTERLKVRQGIFSVRIDEMELFRIKDLAMEKPFWLRPFKLANIIIYTSDITAQRDYIWAIKNGDKLIETLRTQVNYLRREKHVTEIDIKKLDENAGKILK